LGIIVFLNHKSNKYEHFEFSENFELTYFSQGSKSSELYKKKLIFWYIDSIINIAKYEF